MDFYGDDLLLGTPAARELYASVRDLPILDYHCHLDQFAIARDDKFGDVGELWLGADHYKWRAMRMCGVDEELITGGAPMRDKFMAYAACMPRLAGNPLYYWTQLELKNIFGINEPLDSGSAADIYDRANERLKELSVRKLLDMFKVRFIATTDDPAGDLSAHGMAGDILVTPTFRPDRLYNGQMTALVRDLEKVTGKKITALSDLLGALENRLDYFISKGCRIADHGFTRFPTAYASEKEAGAAFAKGDKATAAEKEGLFGYLLDALARMYAARGILMQIHFSVLRNVNSRIFATQGVDRGCDVFDRSERAAGVIAFLDRTEGERPDILLYTLDPTAVPMLATLTGAFRGVRMGAAWWFNDTLLGIRRNLEQIAEYGCLGTHLGMLTDSRSFSSYSRFEFFRRILCDYVGGMVDRGEYSARSAERLVRDICYGNIAERLGMEQ